MANFSDVILQADLLEGQFESFTNHYLDLITNKINSYHPSLQILHPLNHYLMQFKYLLKKQRKAYKNIISALVKKIQPTIEVMHEIEQIANNNILEHKELFDSEIIKIENTILFQRNQIQFLLAQHQKYLELALILLKNKLQKCFNYLFAQCLKLKQLKYTQNFIHTKIMFFQISLKNRNLCLLTFAQQLNFFDNYINKFSMNDIIA